MASCISYLINHGLPYRLPTNVSQGSSKIILKITLTAVELLKNTCVIVQHSHCDGWSFLNDGSRSVAHLVLWTNSRQQCSWGNDYDKKYEIGPVLSKSASTALKPHEIGQQHSFNLLPPKMFFLATVRLRLLLWVWPTYIKDPCRERKPFSLPFACLRVIISDQVSPKEQGETSVRVGGESDGKSLFCWTSETVA